MTCQSSAVVIIGAGPVGLYAALHLAQAGIKLAVYDALDVLSDSPRALVLPNFSITLGAKLERLDQSSDGVQAHFLVNGATLSVKAIFLVGADGGKSTVRHLLDIPLEGFTWDDFNIVAADIEYDVEEEENWDSANYVVDPIYWAVVSRYSKEKEFRIASGEAVSHGSVWNSEEATKRLRERLEKIISPRAAAAKVLRIAPYRSHQRCATRFVQGRVILVGDAAHLTNPTGGLGLTTGLLDSALLGRLLIQAVNNNDQIYPDLLARYEKERRHAFLAYTDPIATQNRKRLLSTSPEDIKDREEYFAHLNAKDMPWITNMLQEEAKISSTFGQQ